VRTASGAELEREIEVPGAPADVTVAARKKR
jgi:hypothetical protein